MEQNILAKLKEEYYINSNTPNGRVDWAVNDFIQSRQLTPEQHQTLMNATATEVKEAQ